MALPTSYTEDALKTFMLKELKALGAALGLTVDDFDEAVNDTLLAYGVNDIADATDIPKLRAIAKVKAWKAAVGAASGRIDWSEAGASFKQSQYRSAAEAGLKLALADAVKADYLPDPDAWDSGEITVGHMNIYDPYA